MGLWGCQDFSFSLTHLIFYLLSISRVHTLDLKLPFNNNHEAHSLRDNAGTRLQLKEEANTQKWSAMVNEDHRWKYFLFFHVDLLEC